MPKETMTLKDWQGSNYFCFKGRCLIGAQGIKPIILTATMLPIPIILFLSFYSKFLIDKFTWAVIIIPIVLFIAALILLFSTSFADPGIMKRNTDVYGSHEVIVKSVHLGRLIKTKICQTCHTVKPYRSAHCADCDNCVLNFDHHCPWIGNCVGLRNYLYFYFFVIILNVESWYIGAFAIAHMCLVIIPDEDKVKALGKSIISLIVVILILIEMIFITGLMFYHTMLICTNRSTKEEIKKLLVSPIGNVYDRGVCGNIKNACCRQRPKLGIIRAIGMNMMTVENKGKYKEKPRHKDRNVEIRPYQDQYDNGNDNDNEQGSYTRKMRQEIYSCSSFYGNVNEISDTNLSVDNKKRICNTSFHHYSRDNSCNNSLLINKDITLSESEENSYQIHQKLKQLPSEISIPKENSCDVLLHQ